MHMEMNIGKNRIKEIKAKLLHSSLFSFLTIAGVVCILVGIIWEKDMKVRKREI